MGREVDRRGAFEDLFAAHYWAVRAYVLRRAPAASAEDVIAETFLVAWRRLDSLGEDPLPWLFGVARHVMANQQRAERRRGALTDRLRELVAGQVSQWEPPTAMSEELARGDGEALAPGARGAAARRLGGARRGARRSRRGLQPGRLPSAPAPRPPARRRRPCRSPHRPRSRRSLEGHRDHRGTRHRPGRRGQPRPRLGVAHRAGSRRGRAGPAAGPRRRRHACRTRRRRLGRGSSPRSSRCWWSSSSPPWCCGPAARRRPARARTGACSVTPRCRAHPAGPAHHRRRHVPRGRASCAGGSRRWDRGFTVRQVGANGIVVTASKARALERARDRAPRHHRPPSCSSMTGRPTC